MTDSKQLDVTGTERDQQLERLFAMTPAAPADAEFTRDVMSRTRRFTWRAVLYAVLAVALLTTVLLALGVPLDDGVLWVVQLVAMPLFPMPDAWWSWVLAPVNTLGAVLALGFKLLRMLGRRAVGSAYVD